MIAAVGALIASPLALAVMLAGVAAGGVARGYSGFGMSALVVASWSLVAHPPVAVAVAVMLEVVASVQQAASVWRDVPWRRVGLLLLGAAIGTPLGVRLLVGLDPAVLRFGIAAFVLAASLLLLAGFSWRRRTGTLGTVAVGSLSGAANGAVSMGGLPLALFLTAEGDAPARMRAAAIAYFFFLDALTVALFVRHGVATAPVVGLAALAAPVMLAGVWLGSRRFAGASPEGFRRSVLWLLLAIAAIGIARSLWDALA